MRNANSDNKRGYKRSERQTREAGKFAFHRYDKLEQMDRKLLAKVRKAKKPKL